MNHKHESANFTSVLSCWLGSGYGVLLPCVLSDKMIPIFPTPSIKEFTLLLHVNSDFVDDIEESYIQYLRHRGDEGVSAAAAEAAEAAKDRLFKRKATRYLKIGLFLEYGNDNICGRALRNA